MGILDRILTFIGDTYRGISFKVGETTFTLNSILQLLICFIIVIALARLIKNILKKRVLIKIGIEQSSREAIANLITYGVVIFTFIIILQSIGFNLSSLAVIGGALGVGMGFGLQNLTKNFVSGLTLLVEQTIKVGDFVEFDGLEGYVKEISTRSTIIRTRDGADVVVPNSQLVENRLVNWSYESSLGRIHLPVGVEYGSDPLLVTEVLLKSAYMESNVLHNPPPKVMFMGFGDSNLNFELWVWIKQIDDKPDIASALYFIIEYNLRQHNINIPFPQLDISIRNPEIFQQKTAGQDNKTGKLLSPPEVASNYCPLPIKVLLRQVSYFKDFNDLELRGLIEVGCRILLKQSEILFEENDPGDAFYIVLSGSVEVFVKKLNKHLTILKSGDFFGELSLMLGIPRTATVRALENTILFSIRKDSFQKLLREHDDFYELIVDSLGKHKAELSERQQQLKELGLVDDEEDDSNPVLWVRKRLRKIFSL
jgi:small-conductance mechanosensitive channel